MSCSTVPSGLRHKFVQTRRPTGTTSCVGYNATDASSPLQALPRVLTANLQYASPSVWPNGNSVQEYKCQSFLNGLDFLGLIYFCEEMKEKCWKYFR